MANLRAGLIGIGSMGKNHARNLRNLEGVDLVGVADQNGDPFNVAGGLEVLPDVDALIKVGLDYCVVAVPTFLHEEIGTKLAEAGVHALIEKPLAVDFEAALKLQKVFDKNGVIGGVGHIERYNASLQEMRRRLADNQLGEIYQICTFRQGPFPNRIADVGVIKDLCSHDIDLTAWVTGRDYELVSARSAFKTGRKFEDMVLASCTLTDGLISNHMVNWLTPVKERRTVVTGEKGMLVADTLTADLTFYANGTVETQWEDISHFRGVSEGSVIRYAIAKPEPLRTEHEHFRDAVLGKEGADIVTLAQGAQVVRVCEAMIESAKTDTFISLTD